jgi:hypothetical protein
MQNYLELFLAFFALLEILLRIVPTKRDWSIISQVHKLLQKLVPNNRLR